MLSNFNANSIVESIKGGKKMKTINKILLLTVLFLMAIIGIDKVTAATYNGKIYDVYHPDSGFTVFAEEKNRWMDYNSWIIKSSIDDRIYYCIDPAIALGEAPAGSYTYITGKNNIIGKANLTKEKYEKVTLLAFYGYGYRNESIDHTSKKWYGITQVMIWRVMRPDLTWTFKNGRNGLPNNNLFKEEVEELNTLVKNHGKVPSFQNKNLKLLLGESIILTDTNKVLSRFSRVNTPKNVTIKEENNKITITAKKNGTEAINYSFRNGLTNPIALLTSSNYQNVLTRGILPDLPNFGIKIEVTGGVLSLQKLDNETKQNKPRGEATLKGAIYEVYDENNNKKDQITTDSKGKGEIILDYGKYTLKEKKAPEGYNLNIEEYNFEITKENPNITLNVKDKVITGKILLTKEKGGSGEKFTKEANAVFEVIDSKGEVIDKLTTNKNGLAIALLPYGTYTIQQVTGEENYVLSEDIKVSIKENKIYEVNIKNLKLSKLEFTKTDFSTDKPLPNTLIEIYQDDDSLIYQGRTDKNGKIEVPNLKIGKYYILEKEAPKYYRLNTEKMPFEITENGQIIKVTMQNKRKEGNLELIKIDSLTKKPLASSLIEIYFTETNEKVFKGKTDKDGKIFIEGLLAGNYCIYERKAPLGYELLNEPICLEIKEENETVKITIPNDKIINVPDTHLDKLPIIAILGIIFITSGVTILLYAKKKN